MKLSGQQAPVCCHCRAGSIVGFASQSRNSENILRYVTGDRRRGIAAAVISLGLAAGAMIFPKLIDGLISLYGWRGA